MKVPWISKRRIAEKAPDLIENFQAMAGYPVRPPVPLEDIVEHCINLRLIYDDIPDSLSSHTNTDLAVMDLGGQTGDAILAVKTKFNFQTLRNFKKSALFHLFIYRCTV
jgi:hypothetical protein